MIMAKIIIGKAELYLEKYVPSPMGVISYQAALEIEKELERLKEIIRDLEQRIRGKDS